MTNKEEKELRGGILTLLTNLELLDEIKRRLNTQPAVVFYDNSVPGTTPAEIITSHELKPERKRSKIRRAGRRNKQWTATEIAEVNRMVAAGKSYRTISRKMKRTVASITNLIYNQRRRPQKIHYLKTKGQSNEQRSIF